VKLGAIMHPLSIHQELASILKLAKKIDYNGILLYLVNQNLLNKVLALELSVRAYNLDNNILKKNHFYEYAKIINPSAPAFKYTLSMKHKKKEIFDPIKVQKALPAEFEIWKNKSRVLLEKQIKNTDSSITDEQARFLRSSLEKEIYATKEKLDEVLANYHSFHVVISTFEDYTYYPALYFVIELADGKLKPSDTHLRKDVPNILFFLDQRPYSQLRANDRMSRIINDFQRFAGSIYIQNK
jgi:hypothetical protein